MNIHSIALAEATAIAPAQHVLHRDYETRGVLQLQKVGPWKYAADDRTEVLCCAFSLDNEPVKLWLPGDPVPPEFLEAAGDPAWLVCAHNAQFELAIEHLIMRRRHGWPKIPLRQQRCTMAAALALALPPKLELVAEALELLHQKDRAGQRLMLMRQPSLLQLEHAASLIIAMQHLLHPAGSGKLAHLNVHDRSSRCAKNSLALMDIAHFSWSLHQLCALQGLRPFGASSVHAVALYRAAFPPSAW